MSRISMTSSPTTSSPPPWTSPWWTWHWPTSPPLALVCTYKNISTSIHHVQCCCVQVFLTSVGRSPGCRWRGRTCSLTTRGWRTPASTPGGCSTWATTPTRCATTPPSSPPSGGCSPSGRGSLPGPRVSCAASWRGAASARRRSPGSGSTTAGALTLLLFTLLLFDEKEAISSTSIIYILFCKILLYEDRLCLGLTMGTTCPRVTVCSWWRLTTSGEPWPPSPRPTPTPPPPSSSSSWRMTWTGQRPTSCSPTWRWILQMRHKDNHS